jgi:membrane-associated phospholipid phosphatase
MGSLEAFLSNGISLSPVEGWLTKSLLDSFQSEQNITTNDSLLWDNTFQSEQDITANDSLVWDNREKHSLSCDLQHWLASFPGSAVNNLIAKSRDILTGITENTLLAFITDSNLLTIPPAIAATLANDTAPGGTTNSDCITSNPTITGTVVDAGDVVSFHAGFDRTPLDRFVDVLSDRKSDGSFRLDRDRLNQIFGATLPDGSHTLHLLAQDKYGNTSDSYDIAFTLDTTAPTLSELTLPPSDSTPNVKQTTSAIDTLVGQTEANASVNLQGTDLSTTADENGQFQFSDMALAVGENQFIVQATDKAGNTNTVTNTITRLPESDVVLDWNATLLKAVQVDKTAPPLAAHNMAMVHAAVYDAVNDITRTHSIYHADVPAPEGASPEAAAAEAAYSILVNLYPQQKATFDTALETSLAAIPDGKAEDDGIAVGQQVADKILAWRSHDGGNTPVEYVPGKQPGEWQPTAPAYQSALLPQWKSVTCFAMTSGSQFRPDGSLALDSAEYAADLNQVKELGRSDSTTRTPEQTEIANFWADGAGTYTPPGHWNQIAEEVSLQQGNSLEENARLFALLNIALADAGIVAWDAKYADNFWRPITAIQQADKDNNPLTSADPTWTPLLTTPPFPEYVSGHSTFSGAAATILTDFFGEQVSFTTTSIGLPEVERSFGSFSAAAQEAGISRIYGGIHFNSANQDGLAAGQALGDYVFGNFLV